MEHPESCMQESQTKQKWSTQYNIDNGLPLNNKLSVWDTEPITQTFANPFCIMHLTINTNLYFTMWSHTQHNHLFILNCMFYSSKNIPFLQALWCPIEVTGLPNTIQPNQSLDSPGLEVHYQAGLHWGLRELCPTTTAETPGHRAENSLCTVTHFWTLHSVKLKWILRTVTFPVFAEYNISNQRLQ